MSSPKKDLIIIGASGFAREAAWIAHEQNLIREEWNFLGYLDDNGAIHGKEIYGGKVLGPVGAASEYPNALFSIAIGSPRVRKIVHGKLALSDDRYATLIDPYVRKSDSVTIGAGSIICAGVVATVNINIGKHVHLNLNSTVGHDTVIGDFSTVAPLCAISGNVTLSEGSEVGTGASIRQGAHFGPGAMLGMGGVSVKDIPTNEVWVGNPAKKLK